MSWSRANTGWRESWTCFAPMAWNFFMTAEVLSWVITWRGRMEMKSPVRSGRFGPSARCACAIFSAMVCPMGASLLGEVLERLEAHEVGVVDDERLGRALDQVPLVGVRGDDVAHG